MTPALAPADAPAAGVLCLLRLLCRRTRWSAWRSGPPPRRSPLTTLVSFSCFGAALELGRNRAWLALRIILVVGRKFVCTRRHLFAVLVSQAALVFACTLAFPALEHCP